MEQKARYQMLKDRSVREKLLYWRRSLENNLGERARLRRAESPDDVLLTEAFRNFLEAMPEEWANPKQLPASALVAAIVAHVNAHDTETYGSISFASQLATPKDGDDKPRLSELRFQQLQKSHDPTEFFRRLLRAVRILDRNVNIPSLANDALHWMQEYSNGVERNPQERLAFCWANDYYRTLLPKKSQ
ncbi:type I-E CRISPR-associated protein Cse2/CasB [Geoalkalibacter halelectricus]|uniref:type I-E CRISPR-associated protein Cse2/CasB n=1 Tax=Geoalkalibacter halelectricus TaxID=2847045 RepID=UPI003D229AE0